MRRRCRRIEPCSGRDANHGPLLLRHSALQQDVYSAQGAAQIALCSWAKDGCPTGDAPQSLQLGLELLRPPPLLLFRLRSSVLSGHVAKVLPRPLSELRAGRVSRLERGKM